MSDQDQRDFSRRKLVILAALADYPLEYLQCHAVLIQVEPQQAAPDENNRLSGLKG